MLRVVVRNSVGYAFALVAELPVLIVSVFSELVRRVVLDGFFKELIHRAAGFHAHQSQPRHIRQSKSACWPFMAVRNGLSADVEIVVFQRG